MSRLTKKRRGKGCGVKSPKPVRSYEGENPGNGLIQSIVDAMPAHVALLNREGRIIAVNPAWTRFAQENGGEGKQLGVGADYFAVCRKSGSEGEPLAIRVLEALEEIASGKRERFSCDYPCHGLGQERWFTMEAAPAKSVGGVLVIHSNTTVRQKTEEQLRINEERLRVAISAAPLAVWQQDLALRYTWIHIPETYRRYSAEFLGKTDEEILPPGNPIRRLVDLKRWVLATGTPVREEIELIDTQGYSTVWDTCIEALRNDQGQIAGLNCAALDITEHKRVEEALRDSERRLALAIESGRLGSWEWDPRTNRAIWNARKFELLGLVPGEHQAGAELFFRYVHPEDVASLKQSLETVLREGSQWTREFRVIRADEQVRWLAASGRVVRDAEGNAVRMVGVTYDITDRKQSEQELERLVAERTRELREINEQLNAFCYSVAHDLKAPLRAQAVFAALLETDFGEALGETGRHFAHRIREAAERQSLLVTDLLSHMSLSRTDLPVQPLDLGQTIEQVKQDFAEEMRRKEAELTLGALTGKVLANPASLHLVFQNLFSNALKFIPHSGVHPRVRIWSESRAGFERVWVEDNGIGIPREQLPKVFGVFQRLHTDENYPGTGMGLAIVKRAVERMGGHVGVESEVGQGSRFWVELPHPPGSQ